MATAVSTTTTSSTAGMLQDAVADSRLFSACADEDWEEAARLIASNQGLNYVDGIQRTVLHIALAARAPLSVIQQLIAKGSDVNQCNLWGGNSLHVAITSHPDPFIIQQLIAKGVRVNQPADLEGDTPLILAARRSEVPMSYEVFRSLLVAGADPNAKNEKNRTALSIIALQPGERRMAMSLLARYGGNITPELVQMATTAGNVQMSVDLFEIRLMMAISSPRLVKRLRLPGCYVHLLPSDLIRTVRSTLF